MMESFQICLEARAADMKLLPYAVVCLNGRFDWLPYEEVIQNTIIKDKRV